MTVIDDIRNEVNKLYNELQEQHNPKVDRKVKERVKTLIQRLQSSTRHVKHVRHNLFKKERITFTEGICEDIKRLPQEWERVERERSMLNNKKTTMTAQIGALEKGLGIAEDYKKALEEKIEADAELQAEREFQKWRKEYEKEHPEAKAKYERAKADRDDR